MIARVDATGQPIGTMLVTVPYRNDQLERLRTAVAPAAVIVAPADDEPAVAGALASADVAVIRQWIDGRFLAAPHLRWIHADYAGFDRSATPELFASGLVVTGASGRAAAPLAEQVFFHLLALNFGVAELLERQRRHEWFGSRQFAGRTALVGKTLGVVGYGAVGRAVAALGAAFGMDVEVYRRRNEHDAGGPTTFSAEAGDRLADVVARWDALVLTASLNDSSHRLVDAAVLRAMKPTAYVVNIARGELLDEDALVDALAAGRLGGAGLDAFAVEPLPPEHPLWDAPRVMITPHAGPRAADDLERSLSILLDNVQRYREGRDLRNRLSPTELYSPSPIARHD